MPDYEVRIRFDDRGRAKIVTPEAGGGAGGAQGQPVATTTGEPLPSVPAGGSTQDIARAIRGDTSWMGGQLPSWMDPTHIYGSALGRIATAATDPMMSGAQQRAVGAEQGARVASYAAAQPGIQAAGMVSETAGREAQAMATAVANAVGEAVRVSMREAAETGAAATRTVQGVAGQMARAGVQMSDEQITTLIQRQTAQERLAYEAMTRVAALSGNITSGAVQAVQSHVATAESQLLLGDPGEYERLRREAQERIQANRATKGR